MSARLWRFEPVGIDLFAPTQRAPEAGTTVRKVQPFGCPRNGTMGHTYVAPVGRPDDEFALVLLASLAPVGKP